MERQQLLESWIKTRFPNKPFTLAPASADASFRRYFRVSFDDSTLVAMDAPPQQEDCTPFVHVAVIASFEHDAWLSKKQSWRTHYA